jgi:acylphosphatase
VKREVKVVNGGAVRVLFRGRVQGVGFRATTAAIASRLHLEGFVRNLPDGRVEVVCCQGDGLNKLLEALESAYPGYIQGTDVEALEPTAGLAFSGFQIRR